MKGATDKDKIKLEAKQAAIYKKIGARIKQLRKEKGYSSYEDFAYENDINRSQFGKYERGADMRISTLVKILDALDVDLKEFVKGMED
ncbi:helix-turn-helix domain-containing protein [Chitinophaga sancti]|uniref:Helix-turn-helix domain-containing protein n=1 Tax=Chitinophaga sancti TaxID=1004 RepID=A0A1K1Q062_9BACT|nr:helix-turn-helix transcriptional regulator [Chitinophaga sancti]WQD61460.1 helix-turn-helix transcriptional regulator [Chitinophaga sancti]WQG92983.1 helix-turn-helix transcriptional regulator [Chitinophaga sancti]SFW53121.1 Helix-turn-helix domain-containing protein [Chitinophaga sancti]